ncbi:MAG TPA: energy transducer TonB [Terriglobales bacterium]|nr:energy transducer TonB [Terriglobales bacterium]
MFEDSLFASQAIRSRQRRWAATAAFVMQTLCVGILLVIPLLFTEALPVRRWVYGDAIPAPPPPPVASRSDVRSSRPAPAEIVPVHGIQAPREIPRGVPNLPEESLSPPAWSNDGGFGVPGGTGPRTDSLFASVLSESRPAPELPWAAVSKPPTKVSTGVAEGLLISKVTPVYPALARSARIQGQVILQAVIGKDGTIQNLHVIKGHPLLIESAMDAVKKWRYRPYLLNREPVEVETQITVNFSLSG